MMQPLQPCRRKETTQIPRADTRPMMMMTYCPNVSTTMLLFFYAQAQSRVKSPRLPTGVHREGGH